MATDTQHFDLQRMHDRFVACLNEDGTICLDNYVDAYEEISRLLKLFGAVFGFVNSDVVEKIHILKDYRKSELGAEFVTIQSMISYEVTTKTTINKKKASGSRTLLRLHRALEFVVDFLRTIKEAGSDTKLSDVGSKSYYRTLSKHHPWIVRKGVDVALYTLPSRKNLIEKMKVEDVKHTEDLMEKTAILGDKIFANVEKVYAENNLLDLP